MSPQPNPVRPIIAIVDDDPCVRGSLDNLMRSAGMEAVVFSSAKDFLASELRDEIACLLTDLHMPEMTGLELLAELKRLGSRTPIIVMTAYPTDAACDQAFKLGALDFIAKPVDADDLIDAVEAAAQGRTDPHPGKA